MASEIFLPRSASRRLGVACLLAAIGLGAAGLAARAAGWCWNGSASAPRGVWLVTPLPPTATTVPRGHLVAICPPARPLVRLAAARGWLGVGDCPGTGTRPLLKPVAAVAGDRVRLARGRVAAVNGRSLPNTVSLDRLPAWPDGTYTVAPGQVWLFSTYSAESFDSRYFGPVPVAFVRGAARPLWVRGAVQRMTLAQAGPGEQP